MNNKGAYINIVLSVTYMGKRQNYVTFSLPAELADEISNIIKISRKGYKIPTEFLKEAIREKLDKEKGYNKR